MANAEPFIAFLPPGQINHDRINSALRKISEAITALRQTTTAAGISTSTGAPLIVEEETSTLLDIANTRGGAASLSLVPGSEVLEEEGYSNTTLALGKGATRNASGGWIARDTSSAVLYLDRTGFIFNWNTDLIAGDEFAPSPIMTLNGESKTLTVTDLEVHPELILFDDFLSGSSSTSPYIGQMGWTGYTAGGGTITQTTGTTGHPGILELGTGATSTNITTIYHEPNYYQIALQDVAKADWVGGYLSTTGSTAVRMQLTPSVTASNPNGSVGFEALSGDTNWHAITTDGSGSTRTDTGIAIAATTWHNFQIRWIETQTWEFYIDGDLVATHTGSSQNVPSDTTITQIIVQGVSDGTNRTIWTDRIRVFTNLQR